MGHLIPRFSQPPLKKSHKISSRILLAVAIFFCGCDWNGFKTPRESQHIFSIKDIYTYVDPPKNMSMYMYICCWLHVWSNHLRDSQQFMLGLHWRYKSRWSETSTGSVGRGLVGLVGSGSRFSITFPCFLVVCSIISIRKAVGRDFPSAATFGHITCFLIGVHTMPICIGFHRM